MMEYDVGMRSNAVKCVVVDEVDACLFGNGGFLSIMLVLSTCCFQNTRQHQRLERGGRTGIFFKHCGVKQLTPIVANTTTNNLLVQTDHP
jgi:hypothetical protein